MSYIKILVHSVWSTYKRIPYLSDEIRNDVVFHIRENAKQKGIYIDHINGYEEHLHALISLGGNQTISEVMQKIKGESSYWINKQHLTRSKFQWQDDFYAVSIGKKQLDDLRQYIRNQEQHHLARAFHDELETLIEENDLQRFED